MANLNQPFKCLCIFTLFFLFLAVSYTASEIQPQNPSPTTLAHYHQVFYLKNTDPKLLSRQERIKKRKMNRSKNKKHRKKKMVKNLKSRPNFSAMLPKGIVPPSGSSPCHNDQPNSVSFFHCHLTAAEPWGTKKGPIKSYDRHSSPYIYSYIIIIYTRKQFTVIRKMRKLLLLVIAFEVLIILLHCITFLMTFFFFLFSSFIFFLTLCWCCNGWQ